MNESAVKLAKKVMEMLKAEKIARGYSKRAKNGFDRTAPDYMKAWGEYLKLKDDVRSLAYTIIKDNE